MVRRSPFRTLLIVLLVAAGVAASSAAAAPIKLARHPDYRDGRIVFSYLGDIWIANEDGTGVQRLTDHQARDVYPRFSPDGRWVAFSSNRFGNYDVFVMQADGSTVTRLTDDPAPDQDPAWAADGRSVFFTSERNGRGEIFRVWLDSKKVDRITAGLSRAIMPAASRDGRYMAYAAQLLIGFKIQLRDLQTGQERTIGTSGGACRPAFSPDTKELAFVHLDAEPSRLEAVTETSRRTLVADPRLWSYYPEYSPDGRYIAFSVSPEHHRGEDWDLAITETAKPGQIIKLTSGPGNDRVPHWKQ